jgi:hypothetical protein
MVETRERNEGDTRLFANADMWELDDAMDRLRTLNFETFHTPQAAMRRKHPAIRPSIPWIHFGLG